MLYSVFDQRLERQRGGFAAAAVLSTRAAGEGKQGERGVGGINGADDAGAEGGPTSEMTAGATFEGWDAGVWLFASGLYPRLKGLDATDAAYVSASPVFLASGQRASAVGAAFTVSVDNGMSWASSDTDVSGVSGNTATPAGLGTAVLTAARGGASKTVSIVVDMTAPQLTAGAAVSRAGEADWYNGYIKTAAEYGVIRGFEDGSYRPDDRISREQAMTMTARAMKLTGLESGLEEGGAARLPTAFADGAELSEYAREGAAACVKTGIIAGRPGGLAPKSFITRAEVAVIVERLLAKSDLI